MFDGTNHTLSSDVDQNQLFAKFFQEYILSVKISKVQRSGINTIKYHT